MTLPEFGTLRLALDTDVLTVEMNRPDVLNALTPASADDLRAAFEFAADDSIRAVVLTGAGRAFSSGADRLNPDRPTLPDGRPDLLRSLREHYNWPTRAIRALPKPVVAAINGPAVGVAVGYALACDFVVAARSAYLFMPFANLGLVPDGGASVLIPARAGFARFTELSMLAEKLPAPEALAWGLVDRVVDDGEAMAAAVALAQRLADGATGVQAGIKRLVNEGPLAGLDAALDREAVLQGERGVSPDVLEGAMAFIQKRAPRFRPQQVG